MQTHSLNDVGVGNNEGNVVQGAAIFFTECECKNNRGHSSKDDQTEADGETLQHASQANEEQTIKGVLPGSPVEDLTDSVVKTENSLPINVSNTIVSPLSQKRGQK